MRVEPVSDGFAAIVSGIDLVTVPDSPLAAQVRALHRDYPVLAFADQTLTAAEFADFSRVFGALEIDEHLPQFAHPDHREVIILSNVDADGRPDPESAGRGAAWHADSTYKTNPCAHTLLYALEIPDRGGGTLFADMARAYATLPDDIKARIEGRSARHLFGSGPAEGGVAPLRDDQQDLLPAVEHPMVIRHPETGRQALRVNPLHTVGIVGLERSESDALLKTVFDHATKPDFVYHHHWRVGQLVIWDQRCTMHRAEAAYPMDQRRRLLRTKICGAH
jgi:taurine dioxygenase